MFLNVHSAYSLKYGTLSIEQLIVHARRLGIHQMVLTDINNSSGAVEFIRECYKQGVAKEADEIHKGNIPYQIKPVAGIEFRKDNQLLYVGIARNKEGMRELNEFLSHHNIYSIPLPEIPPEMENAYIIYPFHKTFDQVLKANEYVGIRGKQLNLLYKHPLLKQREKLLVWHPVTVGNKITYRLHEYLRAIELNTLLSKVPGKDKCDPDECLIPEEELTQQFEQYPFIVQNTQQLLDSCDLSIYFENTPVPSSKNKFYYTGTLEGDKQMLCQLAKSGLKYRYGEDNPEALARLEKELRIIELKNFCAYFLITYDIVDYAMNTCGFYHVGRGSGANSIVAYCLRITDVDPIDLDLYFERFLHEKRTSPPDFDIDFSWDEREIIQKYVFSRYPQMARCFFRHHQHF
ncbi:PHP domain-containing protein [Pedobacter terrae]|uniref:PHP domain-containing protein n=1 Tax=Pedobacter terrae TaxID=405671 RepID=UPI002FF567BD